MLKRIWNKSAKSKIGLILLFLIIFTTIFILRDDFQPYLLFVRKYIFIILLVLFVLILSLRKIRRSDSNSGRFVTLTLMLIFFGILYFVGAKTGMYAFMQKYNIFKNNAEGGSRTHMPVRTQVFETSAYTSSATSA